jgi:truncated hemoglobin YjbI
VFFLLLAAAVARSETVPLSEAGQPAAPARKIAKEASLYARLGGKKGVTALTDDFLDRLASDARLAANPGVAEIKRVADKAKVKSRFADWACSQTGGPCKAKGPVLEHAPEVKLGPMEWFYVIQDANLSLSDRGVSTREQGEILGLLLKARQ